MSLLGSSSPPTSASNPLKRCVDLSVGSTHAGPPSSDRRHGELPGSHQHIHEAPLGQCTACTESSSQAIASSSARHGFSRSFWGIHPIESVDPLMQCPKNRSALSAGVGSLP